MEKGNGQLIPYLKRQKPNNNYKNLKNKQGKRDKAVGVVNYMYSEEMGNPFVNLVQGKADAAAALSVRSFASLLSVREGLIVQLWLNHG